jgi:hypothetical protein
MAPKRPPKTRSQGPPTPYQSLHERILNRQRRNLVVITAPISSPNQVSNAILDLPITHEEFTPQASSSVIQKQVTERPNSPVGTPNTNLHPTPQSSPNKRVTWFHPIASTPHSRKQGVKNKAEESLHLGGRKAAGGDFSDDETDLEQQGFTKKQKNTQEAQAKSCVIPFQAGEKYFNPNLQNPTYKDPQATNITSMNDYSMSWHPNWEGIEQINPPNNIDNSHKDNQTSAIPPNAPLPFDSGYPRHSEGIQPGTNVDPINPDQNPDNLISPPLSDRLSQISLTQPKITTQTGDNLVNPLQNNIQTTFKKPLITPSKLKPTPKSMEDYSDNLPTYQRPSFNVYRDPQKRQSLPTIPESPRFIDLSSPDTLIPTINNNFGTIITEKLDKVEPMDTSKITTTGIPSQIYPALGNAPTTTEDYRPALNKEQPPPPYPTQWPKQVLNYDMSSQEIQKRLRINKNLQYHIYPNTLESAWGEDPGLRLPPPDLPLDNWNFCWVWNPNAVQYEPTTDEDHYYRCPQRPSLEKNRYYSVRKEYLYLDPEIAVHLPALPYKNDRYVLQPIDHKGKTIPLPWNITPIKIPPIELLPGATRRQGNKTNPSQNPNKETAIIRNINPLFAPFVPSSYSAYTTPQLTTNTVNSRSQILPRHKANTNPSAPPLATPTDKPSSTTNKDNIFAFPPRSNTMPINSLFGSTQTSGTEALTFPTGTNTTTPEIIQAFANPGVPTYMSTTPFQYRTAITTAGHTVPPLIPSLVSSGTTTGGSTIPHFPRITMSHGTGTGTSTGAILQNLVSFYIPPAMEARWAGLT